MEQNETPFRITLASARVNAGMTQDDVAKEMKVSKNTILNWEKGKVKPKPAQFEMMCRLYNAPKDRVKPVIFFKTKVN